MRRSNPKANANASVGAHTAGMITLCTTPCHCTPCSPDCARAAPMRPPIKACDDDDGRPSHHVSRFQTIAPKSAAITVFGLARFVSMIPLPTVFGTAAVMNTAAKFAVDPTRTAMRGERARVETEVATAFAVSWKPFVKSNASAMTTVRTRSARGLPVLDEDRLEDVRRVLARVDR